MLSILQNFILKSLPFASVSEARHAAYCRKFGYNLVSTSTSAPNGYKPCWSKIICILDWMRAAGNDEVAVWVDADALIVKDEPINGLIADGSDLGLCLVETHNAEYYNTGVMVIRNTLKCSRFFEAVLEAGPFGCQADGYIGCPYEGDQGRINEMLRTSDLTVTDIDKKYNSYILTPCHDPVIIAFHGEKNELDMLRLLKHQASLL